MKNIVNTLIILLITNSLVLANGLTLSNISVDQVNSKVSFSVQWNNSWRVTGEPKNYDAVWIFVKFRDCSNQTGTQFTHGLISTTLTDHTLNNLEAVKADGTTGIDAAPNNTGIMLRRNAVGIYPNTAATAITLKVTNLPATGNLDTRVFGIEMVYIPQGSYYLGDGTAAASNTYGVFCNSSADFSPVFINSEAYASNVYTGNAVAQCTYFFNNVPIPGSFPKGYASFHIMKYEITEQQYADFLNTISSAFWNVRFPGSYGIYRNQLTSGSTYPNFYYANRPYRAQNYLSWADISAFLDWACLSPMSELQYEKACRGPQPFANYEYAWGSSTPFISKADQINQLNEDGTEITGTGNCVYNQTVAITGGDAGQGPMRAGIFATATTTTREATGASYYGVMELTGNVAEWCVLAVPSTGPNPNAFTYPLWGNGTLDATGNADVTGWPSSLVGTTDYRTIIKGGHWYSQAREYMTVSSRRFSVLNNTTWNLEVPTLVNNVFTSATNPPPANTYNPIGRNETLGGRGIR